MTDYWFFLSYARRNDRSRYLAADDDKSKKLIRRLYEELAADVLGASAGMTQATKIEEIAFFDQIGIEPGDKWDDTVAEALRTTRVMLCLFSRSYFNSKVCGQEFEVFRRRVKAIAQGGKHPPLIIPILWEREEKLPALPKAVVDLQYTYDKFNDVYRNEGLEFVMRLEKHNDDYQNFLMRLRERIVDVVGTHQLPPLGQVPPLKDVTNPFEVTPPALAAAQVAGVDPENGPSFVHFAYVVGDRQQLANAGTKLDRYGNDGRSWRPYMPEVDKPVGLITQRVATDIDLQHEVLPVTDTFLAQLEKADETNTIVVVIVDPWTLKVQTYFDCMKQYGKSSLVSSGVLVVWSGKEQELGDAEQALRPMVYQAFANTIINNSMYIRPRVASEAELRDEVTNAILEIRRRLNERAKLFRPVETAGFVSVPQVAAPGGGTQ